MSVDSGSAGLPEHNRRITTGNVNSDISPGLRQHITEAAQKICADHNAELADVLKADTAVLLFRSLIHPNGGAAPSVVSGEGLASFGAELGALFSDAVRTGTGLLAVPLTALAQEWIATVTRSAATPNPGNSSENAPVPGETSQRPSPETPGMTVDFTASSANVSSIPTASPEEVRLRKAFKRFMPMLVFSISQGGTGYGLAEKVITLLGRPIYDQACGTGKDRIMAILSAEPDLWAQVAPIEATFSRFLDEFLGYDANVEKSL